MVGIKYQEPDLISGTLKIQSIEFVMPTATRRKRKPGAKPSAADVLSLESTLAFRDHQAYLIRELHHRLHVKVEAELRNRAIYLSFPLARVLHMVTVEPGLSGAQLARRCSMAAQSMNGLLVALEKEGYIERKPDQENARILECYAKPAGVALMRKSMAVAFEVFDSILKVLTARDQAELKRLLRAIINAMAVDGGEATTVVVYPYERKAAGNRITRTAKRKRAR